MGIGLEPNGHCRSTCIHTVNGASNITCMQNLLGYLFGGQGAVIVQLIHAIFLQLALRPLINIGAQFGHVGLGHARFRPLTTYERLGQPELNAKYGARGGKHVVL